MNWPAVLQDFRNSGLSRKAFCEQAGVSLASLGYWLKKERNPVADDSRRADSTFVEVEVGSFVPRVAQGGDRPDELVVELPLGVVLRFRGGSR